MAEGLTASQIAAKIDVKTRTVEKYKEILQAAHGAKNAVQLIAIVIRKKIIE